MMLYSFLFVLVVFLASLEDFSTNVPVQQYAHQHICTSTITAQIANNNCTISTPIVTSMLLFLQLQLLPEIRRSCYIYCVHISYIYI